jgi:adenosine deaminase
VGVIVAAQRTRPPAEAVALAHLGVRHAGKGVVAFGLAGNEAKGPPEPFAEAFAITRKAGLLSTPHAGEHGGPESVRGAIDALGAQRIQHGVRAAEDPVLLERLATQQVTLDVCPTSNIQLGVYPDYAAHTLRTLHAAGVGVSLNADDPLFFGSGLLEEYELARQTFGLDDPALAQIAATSIRASGAPDSVKAEALHGIDRWLAQT